MEVTLHIARPVPERDELASIDRAIDQWTRTVREQAETIDEVQTRLMVRTAKRLAMRLDERLPPILEPRAIAEIRGILLGGIRKLDETDDSRPLDIVDDFLVRAESIRHIIRDAIDEDLGCDPDDAQCLARRLVEWLPRVTRRDLARLVGRDERTLHRWLSGEGGDATRRLYLVVLLVSLLRHGWTSEGVVAWFDRLRHDLNSNRPIDVLDDPAFEQALIAAVREGRAQRGT